MCPPPRPQLGVVQLEVFFLDSDLGCKIAGYVSAKWEYLCNINTFVETMLKCDSYVTSLFTNRCVATRIPRNVHHTLTYCTMNRLQIWRYSLKVGPPLLSRQHCIPGNLKALIFYTGNVWTRRAGETVKTTVQMVA